MTERLRALGRRWPWLGRALDVQERVGQLNGGPVASSITVTAFVSLFPLALVAIAVVGFLAAGDPDVPDRIVRSLSLSGSAASTVRDAISRAMASRQAASVVGLAGLLWSGLGVTNAIAQGVRLPWQRPGAGLRTRLDGIVWCAGGVVLFGGAMALGGVLNFLPDAAPKLLLSALAVAGGLAVELGLFLWTFWVLGDRRPGWRAMVPGAVLGAAGFEILKLVGTVYVPRLVASSSSLYGPLGVVFAILTWLAFFSRLIVYSSTLNVVLWERREGSVTLEVRAPRLPGEVPVEAGRGGTVVAPSGPDPAPS
ncbi:MAG: YihY/virulence factor BrkB family protein [Actinobacteria bacterium]|nr:YihY/virulence factor BrkB family protein [Actinomycetota bacterium]